MQKALVLIAVPLAFELALLGTLAWLLYESEVQTKAEERAKNIIAGTTSTIQLLFDVSFTFLAFDAKNLGFFEKRLDELLDKTPANMEKLKEMVKDDPKHLEIVRRVSIDTQSAFVWIRQAAEKSKAGEKLNITEAFTMRRRLDNIVDELGVIIKDEKREQRKNPQAAENLKNVLKLVLISGIPMSIGIALLLVIVFHQSTTKRLQALMANSVRLGQGRELKPLLEGQDEIARIDRTFHDAADALEQAALKRAELEKIKKQFVAMISHDLRTPISSVTSTLELLGVNAWGQLNDTGQAKVRMAETSLRHSMQLINNLLDLEKMESGTLVLELQNTHIQKLLQRAIDAIFQLAEKKSIDVFVIEEEDVAIEADEFRLTQVLINLLGNAIKFAPPSSEVNIGLDQTESGFLMVKVMDQGPGIPEDHQNLVFERFHQAPSTSEKAKEGTGLGLAICKAIIEGHGGTIGVKNNKSAGSCFWFRIKTVSETA